MPCAQPAARAEGFALLPAETTGVTFVNRLEDSLVSTNRLLEIGSGVALGDVDGNGWVDIYFCGAERNALYLNRGNWSFEESAEDAGIACRHRFSTGCALVDIDGNGTLDLLVNSLGGGTQLFLNDGKGRFSEVADSGLFRRFGATSMALADVDGDGFLDLYTANYRTDTFFDNPAGLVLRQSASMQYEPQERFVTLRAANNLPHVLERGEPDVFYINQGGKKFVPVPWQVGLFVDEKGQKLSDPPDDWGLSVLFRDLNGDGLPDLYVCNDFVYWPDRLWLNLKGRRFQAAPRHAIRCTSLSSMAADAADINRDGFVDFFVADMLNPSREARAWQRPDTLKGVLEWPVEDPGFRPELPRNTLQLSRGDGTFAEIAPLAGLAATDWTTCAAFMDADLDGWEDLLLTAGNNHDVQDLDAQGRLAPGMKTPPMRLKDWQRLPQRDAPCMAFRNCHDLTFANASDAWGFNTRGVAHGMALADLDNDGDLDVVVNSMNSMARIYRNNATAPRIGIRLKGAGGNTHGIGAKIKVSGGPVVQTQEMVAAGRFCSSDDAMRVFAAGNAAALQVEIVWRSGRQSLIRDARPNCIYEIDEAGAGAPPATETKKTPPLFGDATLNLNHWHRDLPFDDFARQPLLPRKLSTLGPGMAWADLNDDGCDDLLIAGGTSSRMAIFLGDGKGGFKEWIDAPVPKTNTCDQTAVLAWPGAEGRIVAAAGESVWEDAAAKAPACRMFSLNGGGLKAPPSDESHSCIGPMAVADVDGDGRLELFAGGRSVAGRYPEPASSSLWRCDRGEFVQMQSFTGLGMVSGAVFFDYDGDGYPDLALACEWGPIRVFHNKHGKLEEATEILGFSEYSGWWNGIAAADFDGDGRMDLAVSNWGRNWRIDQAGESPVLLYYGRFSGDDTVQTLLASLDPALGIITAWRERKAVAAAIPSVSERIASYHAYGRADIAAILGEKYSEAKKLQAVVFESMVFLNQGGRFLARPLPIEAQFAPAFGINAADFDGDGNQDLFLAQNFFGVDKETARNDAGAGLILLGDGQGGFRSLKPAESGISVYGEQRGSAVADFNNDGRLDLAVAQHSSATRLFHNTSGKPGVRLILRGARGNAWAVGAAARLKFGDRFGPTSEVHAGSGYWSQDSARLVLAAPSPPTALWIRWPGGFEQEWPWPPGAVFMEVQETAAK